MAYLICFPGLIPNTIDATDGASFLFLLSTSVNDIYFSPSIIKISMKIPDPSTINIVVSSVSFVICPAD
jgi:hypothetical protein